ncbi:MAG: hypothetical protein SLAVMIC_00502 [uncultured marine phage]|uniref:Uncharacterized protein n=1 Tax=uncultured marine phage TaxID=707152 RepID=A0A8D9CFA2_9VIRU|nr:MAG: hypothetical protein SLAVMIC_00502 [uncultured marine phage]
MKTDKSIKKEARQWLSKSINLDDIGAFNINVEKGQLLFRKFREELSKHDVYRVANFSDEVKEAWYDHKNCGYEGSNVLSINYKNGDSEEIHKDEILKREWFSISLKKMKSENLIEPITKTFTFAIYNPIFPFHSRLNWRTLERSTGKSFEFEKIFKKPKPKRKYATVTI